MSRREEGGAKAAFNVASRKGSVREVGAEVATRCCLFSGSCGAAATSFQL